MSPKKIIMVARVGAPHGVRGLLKLHPFLDNSQLLTQFKQFYVRLPHRDWQEAMPFTLSKKGEHFFIHFTGVDAPEIAGLKFTHAELGVLREALPQLTHQQYYWEDLIGLRVVNLQNQNIGVIDSLFDTPAHDVIVVKNDQHEEILIPYVWQHFIVSVDLNAGFIQVDWEL